MGIEERILELEELTQILSDKIANLECVGNDKWVSAKELADIMGCTVNNVYIKIRSGKVYATNKLGSLPRIPMSQFYQRKEMIKEPSIREKVFRWEGKTNEQPSI
jgi:hypothetical protein